MIKDKKHYRILVIEDNPGDFVIVEDLLTEIILNPVITHAINYSQASNILAAGTVFDVVLLDLSLPDKSRQQLVTEILQITSGCCPVVILTGYTDIDFSIKSVSQGISDYLLKDELDPAMLYKSLVYAIERRKALFELDRSQKQYSDLFNLSPQPMWVFDAETFRFVRVNKAASALYGYSDEEFLNMTLMALKLAEDIPAVIAGIQDPVSSRHAYITSTRHLKKSGEVIEVEIYTTPIIIENRDCRSVIAIDVTEKNESENKLTKAIIKTQEDERYEIGGELHDNVCQILAASHLSLSMLKESLPPSMLPLYEKSKNNISLALDEIRNLSHRLAPAFFDDSTFEEAFTRLFDTFNSDKKLKLFLHFDQTVKNCPISLEIQLHLYRILQEQLRNIQKHAKARSINVDVIIYNKKLIMKMSDDGVGFDIAKVKRGIGLANMKRRAELFSGKFEIDSSPGNGSTILITIPLPETTTALV